MLTVAHSWEGRQPNTESSGCMSMSVQQHAEPHIAPDEQVTWQPLCHHHLSLKIIKHNSCWRETWCWPLNLGKLMLLSTKTLKRSQLKVRRSCSPSETFAVCRWGSPWWGRWWSTSGSWGLDWWSSLRPSPGPSAILQAGGSSVASTTDRGTPLSPAGAAPPLL